MTHLFNATLHPLDSLLRHPRLAVAAVRDILRDAVKNYEGNGDTNQAAAIALYAILSIIPLFILTMLMAGQFFGSYPNIQHDITEGIRGLHPYLSGDLLDQLGRIDEKQSVLGWVGIATLIWFSAMIFGAIETAFNLIFRAKAHRNYIVSKLLAIGMIPMGWAVGIASIVVTSVAAILAQQPTIFKGEILILHGFFFRYILPYLVTVSFFTIVYKVIPHVRISWWSALIGSAIFSALMEMAKHFFGWYVSNYTSYNVIFGSLQTVVILVIWVFYMALILLFCAEIISSFQRRDMILLENALLKPGKDRVATDERLFRKFGHIYPKEQYIFREGDPGREMYYILNGRVRLEKRAGQVKKVLAELDPGAYFGEMSALIDAPRTASAIASEDCHLAAIDGDTFRHLIRESGEMSLFMLKEFSRRIKNTNAALEELTHEWIKLMAVLYFFKEWPLKAGQAPAAELAGYTGKDPVDIDDVFKDLQDEGVIVLQEGQVTGFIKEKAWDLLSRHVFG
ncbi:MAG: YhjD/YihY/BrkB family envelope integrity protein [Pseudomonadota bacterium]